MSRQIVKVAPFQAGKVLVATFFTVAVPVAVGTAILILLVPSLEGIVEGSAEGTAGPHPVLTLLTMPFVHALSVFIFTAIGCGLYNLVAKQVGGIEITLQEIGDT